jgi:hypothetical protein
VRCASRSPLSGIYLTPFYDNKGAHAAVPHRHERSLEPMIIGHRHERSLEPMIIGQAVSRSVLHVRPHRSSSAPLSFAPRTPSAGPSPARPCTASCRVVSCNIRYIYATQGRARCGAGTVLCRGAGLGAVAARRVLRAAAVGARQGQRRPHRRARAARPRSGGARRVRAVRKAADADDSAHCGSMWPRALLRGLVADCLECGWRSSLPPARCALPMGS